ncbi:MAG TPA: tRNA (guanine(10)-N(2))-dimethyltransferase [Candidatus Bathyarchaeia archaeon]|nr:tRNA (guanine(10)-N(2))-dimethyltransferase [Candidatus Bathyarchaeia archaeon]
MSAGFPTENVKEGNVEFLAPKRGAFVKEAWEYAPSKAPVFYNPAMELNRDIAVLAVQAYQKTVKHEIIACEPLTGCGVRGIRLAREVNGVDKVVINDISAEAAELAQFNVKLNNLADRVSITNEDANLMLSRYAAPRKRFNYVDVDPFGTPAPYIDSAVRALGNGGLVALTATDMAPLCGVHPKACVRKYGGRPLRTEYCHEVAVRLLLGCFASTAAKHDIGVTPVLSYSHYNYVRAYATIDYGAKQADKSIQGMGYILHCFSCFHRESQEGLIPLLKQVCSECGSKLRAAGPLWLGSLWDEKFCVRTRDEVKGRNLRNEPKILNMLSLMIREVSAPITYYAIDKLCDKFNLPVPSLSKVINGLTAGGFQAVPTHFNSKAVRTDASANVLREVLTSLTGASRS